jgi:hypothetical protein
LTGFDWAGRFASEKERNYLELSWKSRTCVSSSDPKGKSVLGKSFAAKERKEHIEKHLGRLLLCDLSRSFAANPSFVAKPDLRPARMATQEKIFQRLYSLVLTCTDLY